VQNDSARNQRRGAASISRVAGVLPGLGRDGGLRRKRIGRAVDASGMGIVPRTLVEKVQFFSTRLATFAEHAAALGLSKAEVAELAAAVEEAEAAMRAQREAQLAAQGATARANLAIDLVGVKGAAIVARIRATARGNDDPSLYPLASLDAPAARSAVPAPGTPEQFSTRITGNGRLELTWTCANPKGSTGTTYQISRRIGDGPFEYIGVTGAKRFVDKTIPKGATGLTYQIQSMRSTAIGGVNTFPVTFGTDGQSYPPDYVVKQRKMTLAA
jgi:outer membrane murein-binding lipoprotein Lpp